MTNRFVVFGALFCFLAPVTAVAQERAPGHPDAQLAAIEKLEQADAEAAKSNDVETLVSLWTDDGVLLQPMAAPVIGQGNIRALLEQQRRQTAAVQTVSYTENWKERIVSGNRAFEWGTISVTMRLPNGKEATQSVYAGRLLVRAKTGRWQFARVVITPAKPG